MIADWSAIDRRPVAVSNFAGTYLGDQSPTSRRLIADWFQCQVLSNMTYVASDRFGHLPQKIQATSHRLVAQATSHRLVAN